ncbi:uncharacterized protein LOC117325105 isoform X2 [Pecten maximus]|uniref:uncharacterized protein LOC117325105 isoform X2 n=1 Tax=Pecten maximus TaxID=6579 RepID=UPI001458DEAA|nr:uncharacterized protein LOC117325105 isoform X2 [Pecten maximus]
MWRVLMTEEMKIQHSSIDCCEMEHNISETEQISHKSKERRLNPANDRQKQTRDEENEELSCSDDNSLSLFNTNLSQGNTIRSLSQRKFFKERSGSSIYERHDVQSACVSASGVQKKKSCELEYGNSNNRVYLAMSYSSTDRIDIPPGRDVAGDPYDFEQECERSSTRSKSYSKQRHEAKSNGKQGKYGVRAQLGNSDTSSLKKKMFVCKNIMDESTFKENPKPASKLVDNNMFIASKQSNDKGKKKNSSKHQGKFVDGMNDTDAGRDSVYLKGRAPSCLPKKSSNKIQKNLKELHKKKMTSKNVDRLMARFLGRKSNGSTCQDSNENEEYIHDDELCLSKGDSSSPLKIPHCEITLDEVVGVPRILGENNQLPCFKHHKHQSNQQKTARLEGFKVNADCNTQFERKQKMKPKTEERKRRNSFQGPNTRKGTFIEEIETVDSEVSDDQLCRSDDVNLDEKLPPENSIITKFNLFCKSIVGESDENVPIEKSRKETNRALDNANSRKENQACRKNDCGLNSTNDPRTPKFVTYDPEDQVEICSIKTPMTLPCSDIEGSQEESLHSDDLQIQPLQERKEKCNRSRSSMLLQQTKGMDLSGLISGYSTEMRPSRSSLKRKYECMLESGDDDDVFRNNLSAGLDLTDTLEMSHLRPRRLFSSDFKEIAGCSDDEDKEDLYGTSKHNTSSHSSSHNTTSNEMFGNSMSHLEGIGVDDGVSMIVKAFGMDFKKQMQTKQHCLDVLAKTALKSSQKHLRNILTDRTERRTNIMQRFEKKLLAELAALGNDVRTLEDSEAKTLDFFQQQMQTINNCRISQEKRLENLKKMQMDFMASMCHMDQYESNQQKTFKNSMEKDLTTMEKKLLADAQRHELTTVRRSLHSMIG